VQSVQEGAALAQPDANETPVNTQAAIAEPVVEDPQPDGVVPSKVADFTKAESEQVLPSIRRPTIALKTQQWDSGYQILPKWISRWYLRTQRISVPTTNWNATLAELPQASPRRIGNPSTDLTRFMHPNMRSKEVRGAHW